MAAKRALQFGKDVALKAAALAAFVHRNRCPARDDFFVRLDADEGVAAHVLAALNRFQQEGLRLAVRDAQEGRDGRLQVRRQRAIDGNQRMLAAQLDEISGRGQGRLGGLCGSGGHGV